MSSPSHRPDWYGIAAAIALAALAVPAVSGMFRSLVGVSIGAGLAASAVSVGGALGWLLASALRPSSPAPNPRHAFALFAVGAGATALVLYNPSFDGLITVGGGDPGIHVYNARTFVASEPGAYWSFVAAYSLWHWLWQLGFDPFEAIRIGFYATCSALIAAWAYAVMLTRPAGQSTWRQVAVASVGFCAAAFFVHWPLLHYNQGNGFYAHLFCLVPLMAGWIAYAKLEDPRARVVLLAVLVGIVRFTYGLNLGDVALSFAVLIGLEAVALGSSVPNARRWRMGMVVLAVGCAAGAVAAYRAMLVMRALPAGIDPTRIEWLLRGLPVLELFVLLFAVRPTSLPPMGVRLARFAAAYGGVNLFGHLTYVATGQPREYYFSKYGLHASLLLSTAAVVLASWALASSARWRWRMAAVAACVLGLIPVARAYPYRTTFLQRLRHQPTWAWIGPLSDRDADARIEQTLSREHKAFGGLITASWPMASFMNSAHGRFTEFAEYERALVNEEPGHCVFWLAHEHAPIGRFESGDQSARPAALARLNAERDARCEVYPARWDPTGQQRLCSLCR